jgi:ABC-2 type transport system ATP-binding protein
MGFAPGPEALRPVPVGPSTAGGLDGGLAVIGLRKTFGRSGGRGGRVALDNLTLEVGRGEIFGLLGPNGAGKTTAFRLLAGLLPTDGGAVFLDGVEVDPTLPAFRRRLGVVFQEPSLDLKLTGRENLTLGAALFGLSRAVSRARIADALALMELGPRADEAVQKYSGGMRRRLEIARVLLHEPALLLLDEPGRGVDPEALRRIWTEIERLTVERGLSVLVTTHQAEEAERCRRVALLDAGRLLVTGTPDGLRAMVAGDVIRIEAERPEEILAGIEAHRAELGLAGGAGLRVLDGQVWLEAPRGHELIPRIVELHPPGRLRALSLARPTLADVFAKLTGRAFVDEARAA